MKINLFRFSNFKKVPLKFEVLLIPKCFYAKQLFSLYFVEFRIQKKYCNVLNQNKKTILKCCKFYLKFLTLNRHRGRLQNSKTASLCISKEDIQQPKNSVKFFFYLSFMQFWAEKKNEIRNFFKNTWVVCLFQMLI